MHLQWTAGLLSVAGVLLVPAGPTAQSGPIKAKAVLRGEGVSGTATLREISARTEGPTDSRYPTGLAAVEITVDVTGLKPGPHGLHVHAVGRCDPPSFVTAGGHFDPGPAGNTDPDMNHPYHMGDLPNLVADVKGHAKLTALTTRVTLAPGPLSLFGPDGTALIIHANPDQGITGEAKSGLSGGARIACGVIEKQ